MASLALVFRMRNVVDGKLLRAEHDIEYAVRAIGPLLVLHVIPSRFV